MRERPRPIGVTAVEDYKLLILFDNGEKRIFDTKPLISGEWYGQLKDKCVFQSVRISGNTVEWVGGQGVCPDDLYYKSVPACSPSR